jgi:hypothetical protein
MTQAGDAVERYPHKLRVSYRDRKPVAATIDDVKFVPASRASALDEAGEALEEIRKICGSDSAELALGEIEVVADNALAKIKEAGNAEG